MLCSISQGHVDFTNNTASTLSHVKKQPYSLTVKAKVNNENTICDWICQKGSYMRNYKYLEIPN